MLLAAVFSLPRGIVELRSRGFRIFTFLGGFATRLLQGLDGLQLRALLEGRNLHLESFFFYRKALNLCF